jgi:hypothetical protein
MPAVLGHGVDPGQGGRCAVGGEQSPHTTLGALDLLAAAGLVLPAALDIAPVLVPLAAVGIVLLMAGAVITRLRHGGTKAIAIDTAYLATPAVVAVARFGPESFGS